MRLSGHIRRLGQFLRRLQREMGYDDCMGMAAQIAFYLLLSIFPFLVFLLSLISFLPLPDLDRTVLDAMADAMPPEAYQLVSNTVESLLTTRHQSLVGFGLLVALWSGSMGVGAMITTINRAYNIRPRRSIVEQKLLAIALTIALSGIMLLSTVIVLFGPRVTLVIFHGLGLAGDSYNAWTSLRLFVVFGLILLTLAILYYHAPEARQAFRWILPGALTSTVLWLGASSLFRLFVRNFGSYNATYGSLTAVVILMIWMWMTGLIFLLGAEINSLMKRMEAGSEERGRA